MAKPAPVVEKCRQDYKQPNYWVREVHLDVQIFDGHTKVCAAFTCELNTTVASPGAMLHLNGEDIKLESIEILPTLSLEAEGVRLEAGPDGYETVPGGLTIRGPGNKTTFVVRTRVAIEPEKNTKCNGLYYSGATYCTHMEAEGFRRFTFFPDRPDVMAKYTKVRIEAEKDRCPTLLSNGDQIQKGICAQDPQRHFAIFSDPHAKPCYLFAIVCGNLKGQEGDFVSLSGRKRKVSALTEPENADKVEHALASVKKAMKWDEERFGLEYDLETFKIISVSDFNMGAMENKGLNIFNSACMLSRPDTSTDDDFMRIEGIIAHEYFHNWTGNRVTCRDWFQLTLKEGLTVFRDQEFSGDMGSAAVKRIESVRSLRERQFPEDASPRAHPIRPESYIAMDNFFTASVYMKGAEVVRMYQTLLGRAGFRKGMDLYFKRHDGSAVSCDDFRAAMADANGKDFTQFEEWYLQPGTPKVTVKSSWDKEKGIFTLTVAQIIGAGQAHLPAEKRREKPLLIPIVVGLLERNTGKEVVASRVLELTEAEQTFKFEGLQLEPVPSIFRGFSAPVNFEYPYTIEDLAFLAAHDTDSFNRWEAAQKLGMKAVLHAYEASARPNGQFELQPGLAKTFRHILTDKTTTDLSLLAYALILPSEATLMTTMTSPIDPIKLHDARCFVKKALALELKVDFQRIYKELTPAKDSKLLIDGTQIGQRRLRNICLVYLSALQDDDAAKLCATQFEEACRRGCMTDKLAALRQLCEMPETPQAKNALFEFYTDAKGDPLVINKWFMVQASAGVCDIVSRVQTLTKHQDFSYSPNRFRALLNEFAGNVAGFHKADGSGYAFVAKMILQVDSANARTAAKLAETFGVWAKLDQARQGMIKAELASMLKATLSKDAFEVVSKIAGA